MRASSHSSINLSYHCGGKTRSLPLLLLTLLLSNLSVNITAFQIQSSSKKLPWNLYKISRTRNANSHVSSLRVTKPDSTDSTTEDKFTFAQRIESTKTGIVGLLSGGIALTPFAALHDIAFPGSTIENGFAQWEFDTDMGSIETALFAIVYRYCVREGEESNEMLGMGVIGAFVLVRSLSRVRVGSYCSAAPLDCKYKSSQKRHFDLLYFDICYPFHHFL